MSLGFERELGTKIGKALNLNEVCRTGIDDPLNFESNPGEIGNSLWTLWACGANSGSEFPRWEPLLINRKWMVIMPPGANSTEGGAKFNPCVKSHLDPVSRPHVGDVVEVGRCADHLRTSVRVPVEQSVIQSIWSE